MPSNFSCALACLLDPFGTALSSLFDTFSRICVLVSGSDTTLGRQGQSKVVVMEATEAVDAGADRVAAVEEGTDKVAAEQEVAEVVAMEAAAERVVEQAQNGEAEQEEEGEGGGHNEQHRNWHLTATSTKKRGIEEEEEIEIAGSGWQRFYFTSSRISPPPFNPSLF